jgi:hypothetical protein
MNVRRLNRLAETFHRLRPPAKTDAERLAERIANMTTAERVRRIAEIEAEAEALAEHGEDIFTPDRDTWEDA